MAEKKVYCLRCKSKTGNVGITFSTRSVRGRKVKFMFCECEDCGTKKSLIVGNTSGSVKRSRSPKKSKKSRKTSRK